MGFFVCVFLPGLVLVKRWADNGPTNLSGIRNEGKSDSLIWHSFTRFTTVAGPRHITLPCMKSYARTPNRFEFSLLSFLLSMPKTFSPCVIGSHCTRWSPHWSIRSPNIHLFKKPHQVWKKNLSELELMVHIPCDRWSLSMYLKFYTSPSINTWKFSFALLKIVYVCMFSEIREMIRSYAIFNSTIQDIARYFGVIWTVVTWLKRACSLYNENSNHVNYVFHPLQFGSVSWIQYGCSLHSKPWRLKGVRWNYILGYELSCSRGRLSRNFLKLVRQGNQNFSISYSNICSSFERSSKIWEI